MDQNEYSKAFSQLNEIIKNMKMELKKKIPMSVIEAIECAKDDSYIFKYNPKIELANHDLLPETKSLLSIIYSDYLCTPDEKKKWEEYDIFELQQQEKVKEQKYSKFIIDNKRKNACMDNAEKSLVVQEKWYKRILRFLGKFTQNKMKF